MVDTVPAGIGHQADPAQRRRLRWRARRGLLENDLILTRFLDRFEAGMSDEDVAGLDLLLDLPDNELLDLILGRTPASGDLANDPVVTVLRKLQEV